MLHKSKALKRRIGAINIKHSLHNTHSWNDLFHRLKGHVELAVRYRKWWLGPGLRIHSWLRKFGVGSGTGEGLGSVTRTQFTESSKFTKHQISSCNIVMQYTRWHDWDDNNVTFLKSFHIQSGSEWGLGPHWIEDFTPPLALQRRQQRFSILLPCVRGAETDAFSQNPWLEDMLNSSAVFDQTSYLRCYITLH